MVSIVVPCRDEEGFIEPCIVSLLSGDYPLSHLEILVVDGMSRDKTRAIAEQFQAGHPVIRILENPEKTIPTAMNVGIGAARGEVIIKADAHSTYAPDYVTKCVRYCPASVGNGGSPW